MLARVRALWVALAVLTHAARPAEPAPPSDALLPRSPPADTGLDTFAWKEEWRRAQPWELLALGGVAVVAGVALLTPRQEGRPQGGVLFDDRVRSALRLEAPEQRRTARRASDVLVGTLIAYPFVVDALLVSSWIRGNPDVGLQLAIVNAEALGVTLAAQSSTAAWVGRERPYGQLCGTELPEDSEDCESYDRYRSFFSGHASTSFAMAGLMCAHHANLPLYGGGALDGLACGVAVSVAAATALLRVASDMHYATDISVGALVGFAMGFGLPLVLRYLPSGEGEPSETKVGVAITPAGGGLVVRF